MLWGYLQRRQLRGRKFRRQYGIGPYILDFYCQTERLAVELDGAVHADPARQAYDAARTQNLARLGIRVLRFENRAVFDTHDTVLAAIDAAFGE